MTKDEILKIKEHIEIHARKELHAVKITEILKKAVAELECFVELEKENTILKRDKEDLEKALSVCNASNSFNKEQLFKAEDIIRNIVRVTWGEGWNYSLDWKVRAESFLKEICK